MMCVLANRDIAFWKGSPQLYYARTCEAGAVEQEVLELTELRQFLEPCVRHLGALKAEELQVLYLRKVLDVGIADRGVIQDQPSEFFHRGQFPEPSACNLGAFEF